MDSFVVIISQDDVFIDEMEKVYAPLSYSFPTYLHHMPCAYLNCYYHKDCYTYSCRGRDQQRPDGVRRLRRRQASKQPEPGGVSRSLVGIAEHRLPGQSCFRLRSLWHAAALLRRGRDPAR